MAAPNPIAIDWLPNVEPHDFRAAQSYLGLIHGNAVTALLIRKLKKAPVVQFKAKDIFRASGLSLLGVSNSHVEKDRKKIARGLAISPLLLVRDEANGKVVVADGYHRLCAVYQTDEDSWIHCKIV